MCVCVRVCVWGWGGVQISVGAPVHVIKRSCDKDRKRQWRPQAAHYPSATITRNSSDDKCLLTAPLISVAAGCHLTLHGKASLTNTQGCHICNTRPWIFHVAKTRCSVFTLGFSLLKCVTVNQPQIKGQYGLMPFIASEGGIKKQCQCYVIYLWQNSEQARFPPRALYQKKTDVLIWLLALSRT